MHGQIDFSIMVRKHSRAGQCLPAKDSPSDSGLRSGPVSPMHASSLSQPHPLPTASSGWRRPVWVAAGLTAFLLCLTALYWLSESRAGSLRKQQAFSMAADRIAFSVKSRMDTYKMVLQGVKGYHDGSEQIDPHEFQAYVAALNLQDTVPGLQGIAHVKRLPQAHAPAFVQQLRAQGNPLYRIWPEGNRGEYLPITHIEPADTLNQQVLGFDVGTVPAEVQALERARDTGDLALTGILPLRQYDGASQPEGMVLYLPLYQGSTLPGTVQERRDLVMGWVTASFRMQALLYGMRQQLDEDIDLAIYDGATPDPARRLTPPVEVPSGGLEELRRIELGGRQWTLVMRALPGFDGRWHDTGPGLVALLGAVLSLLVGGLAWILATARERALGLAMRMTETLRATRDDLESTLNAIPDLLFELDPDGRIQRYRPGGADLLHAPAALFEGRLLQDVVGPAAAAGCRAALQAAQRTGHSTGQQFSLELNGKTRWFELSLAHKGDGWEAGPRRLIALSRDITERKQSEARTHQLAYFDTLTGLPNRRMLLDRLDNALAWARKTHEVGALLLIDLDNFKQINDARGHRLGDALLLQVAQRLGRLLRPGDTLARLGGDEFVLLLNDVAPDMEAAGRAALLAGEQVQAVLETPYSIEDHPYGSTASIGITLFPKHGEGVQDLLREADTAMYRAKDLGRNRICFYEEAMQADVQERLALEQDLKTAMGSGELAAYLQPQVALDGTVIGGELLMRWNHPARGAVPPSRFIPVAESSGLILRMGDWMLQQACETLAQLQSAGRLVSLSVNVSQRQFRQDDFVERLRRMLEQTGAPPECLILEVTESLLIDDLDNTIARMTALVHMGLRFSIDDFGTGYSSLAYLKRLPLYELKIDRSFVQDTPDDPNDTAIVRSILSVARHLRLHVVAEGVETRAQAEFLTASQCDSLQGYLFGRPEPLGDWLQRFLASPP